MASLVRRLDTGFLTRVAIVSAYTTPSIGCHNGYPGEKTSLSL